MSDPADSFAADRPVLVGGEHQSPVFVAAAAESLTGAGLGRLQELGGGLTLLALQSSALDRLGVEVSPRTRRPGLQLAFTASIDAAQLRHAGWSPSDRALTMRIAADPRSTERDLVTPGHVQPIAIAEDDLLRRDDAAAAAALELARTAGRRPAVALCAVADRRGRPVSLTTARATRTLDRLPYAVTSELRAVHRARRATELSIDCLLPTRDGTFRLAAYYEEPSGSATLALIHGDPRRPPRAPLVHVHRACLLSDVFGSRLCDCRERLDRAVTDIVSAGTGVLIYDKPAIASLTCDRRRPIDVPAVAGLLRRSGTDRVRLAADAHSLAGALQALNIAVETTLANAA